MMKYSLSFPSAIDKMRAIFPNLDIKKDEFFTHDRNNITSEEGEKLFETTFYLSHDFYRKEMNQSLADGLVVDWKLEAVPHLMIKKLIIVLV